jgi:hypothetical protein
MYLYMEGSKGVWEGANPKMKWGVWEGANPKMKWAPNGLNLIQGCQPPARFLDSFESRLQDLSNKYPYALNNLRS